MSDEAREVYLRATWPSDRSTQALHSRLRGRRSRRAIVGPVLIAAGLAAALLLGRRDPPATLPLDHVALQMDGQGRVGGTRAHPEITWLDGTLAVEVEPDRGVHLVVSTPEARVEVVGTRFTVDRRALATTVQVTHGTVALRCSGGPEATLTGAAATCLPEAPADLLIRLATLTQTGAGAAERLATADRGLSVAAADSPLRPELLAYRVKALIDQGTITEALSAAEAYLSTGHEARRAALLSFVARTRYSEARCEARAALERAAAELPAGPEHLMLAACIVDQEPARARQLCEGAEGWAPPEWLAVARDVRARASR